MRCPRWRLSRCLASGADAAPLSYDCDTAPGRYSELKQVQSGPAYRISGRIAGQRAWQGQALGAGGQCHGRERRQPESRDAATHRSQPEGTAGRGPEHHQGGPDGVQTLGHVGLGEELAFVLTVGEGKARVEIGSMRGEAPVDVGAGASVTIVCSTGNFHINDLRFSDADR